MTIPRKQLIETYGSVPTKAQYIHEDRFGSVKFYYVDDALYVFNDNMKRWVKTTTNPMLLTELPGVRVIS